MSTPTFAPGLSSHLPNHLNHHQVSRRVQSPPKAHPNSERASTASGPPTSTSIITSPTTASSPSSSTSSIDSRSPASSALTNSSTFSNGGGISQVSAATSVATTASPRSFVASGSSVGVCASMEDDTEVITDGDERGRRHSRRGSGSGSRELAGLSVQETESAPNDEGLSKAATPIASTSTNIPGKTRRASTLSSSSGSIQRFSSGDDGNWGISAADAGKGGRDSQPARRKAARLGSFRREELTGDGDGMTVEDDGATADTEKDDDDEGEVKPPSAPTHFSTSTASNAANSQPPISQTSSSHPPAPSSSHRRPDPALPPVPSRSQRAHVDLVSYPSADLLRLLASLLEQIAHTNDALRQRQRTASVSRGGSGANSPSAPVADDSETFTSEETQAAFQKGRFDAAPLNSPATPHYQGQAVEEEEEETDVMAEMPVTPGVDLLREVGEGGGVEGFMPSLGGTHTPMPLARRRGSSFVNRRDDGSSPAMSRRSSANTPSLGQVAAVASKSSSGSATPVDTSAAPAPSATSAPPSEPPLSSLLTASSNALSSPSATLCFHARNVPAISIEAYLLRILKYCPTTNEVFLSLLVYFDRMARVGLEAQRVGLAPRGGSQGGASRDGGVKSAGATKDDEGTSKLFAIDSFNIHRLVIAGVTVASKFFSDVFYTNSRYAKVGGLPLHELNQLELQFLLLNDFRLVIPVDELQRYADQLILFWVGRNPSTGHSTHAHPASATTASAPTSTPAKSAPTAANPTFAPRPQHSTPTASSFAASSASFTPRVDSRPRSIRSQPSSSGTSVTSTITPGTPSTPRTGADADSSDEDWSRRQARGSGEDDEEDDEGDDSAVRSRRPSRGSHDAIPMDED